MVEFLEGNTDVLERLVAETYARGLSTRDIEDALRDATGERLLTRTDVSAVTESLWAEYLSFRDRRLDDFDVVYLFLDAIFEPLLRTGTVKDGVLEERRRTKTIPRFFDEHSALTLVFGALTRATARWRAPAHHRP